MFNRILITVGIIGCLPFLYVDSAFSLDECRPSNIVAGSCTYFSYTKTKIGTINSAYSFIDSVSQNPESCLIVNNPKVSYPGGGDYYSYTFSIHEFVSPGVWDRSDNNSYPAVGSLSINGPWVLNGVPPYDCGDCYDEENLANKECGQDNWSWTDESTCQYKCTPPADCNQTDIDTAITECVTEANIEWQEPDAEFSECNYKCKDSCQTEYSELQSICARGIKDFDNVTCIGTCIDCEDIYNFAKETCQDRGGVYAFDCSVNNSIYQDEQSTNYSYECNDTDPGDGTVSLPPEDTDDGTTPDPTDPNNPDPDDPDNQPTPDPVLDPNDTADAQNTDLLGAIKQDLATTVDQNNTQIGQLSDIVANTSTIAKNQGILQDEIGHVADNVRTGSDNIVKAIKGIKSSTTTIGTQTNDFSTHNGIEEVDFSSLATNAQVPAVPDFDSSLPTDNNYTELDDNTTLATDAATTYATANLTVDPSSSPINAEVTATGNACIDGSISMHGSIIPVSICFDRPWMLKGYAIMKILMIGLAYLQSAILLNKAIVA